MDPSFHLRSFFASKQHRSSHRRSKTIRHHDSHTSTVSGTGTPPVIYSPVSSQSSFAADRVRSSPISSPSFPRSPVVDRFIPLRPNTSDNQCSSFKIWQHAKCDSDSKVRNRLHKQTVRDLRSTRRAEILSRGQIRSPILRTSSPVVRRSPVDKRQHTPTSSTSTPCSSPQPDRDENFGSPELMMDMPNVKDDFYTDILHWGKNNILAVGLSRTVYTWVPMDGPCKPVKSASCGVYSGEYITSFKWNDDNYIAVGFSNGLFKIVDVAADNSFYNWVGFKETDKEERIIGMDWRSNTALYCWANSAVHLCDLSDSRSFNCPYALPFQMRSAAKRLGCALKFSPDKRFIAVTGLDGQLVVLDDRNPRHPYFECTCAQSSAIRAMCWHPFKSNMLVTGGGVLDGTIRVWNIFNSTMVAQTETDSQICSALWHPNQSILTTHGGNRDDVLIWSRDLKRIKGRLHCHTSRVLNASLSPDFTRLATLSPDEMACIWKCWSTPKRDTCLSPMSMLKNMR